MPWFRTVQSRRPKEATAAATRAALVDEGFGLSGGGAVAEDNLGAGLAEEADASGADSAGAAGDEGNLTGERHDDA